MVLSFKWIVKNFMRKIPVQLNDLVKPLSDMSVEELETHLHNIRSRREKSGASQKNREKKQARKETTKKVSSVEKLLEGLSPEELAALLTQVEAQK